MKRLSLPSLLVYAPGLIALVGLGCFAYETTQFIRDIPNGARMDMHWPRDFGGNAKLGGIFLTPALISFFAYRRWKPRPRIACLAAIFLTWTWAILPVSTSLVLTKFPPASGETRGLDPAGILALMHVFQGVSLDIPSGFSGSSNSYFPTSRDSNPEWLAQTLIHQIMDAAKRRNIFNNFVIGGSDADSVGRVLQITFVGLHGRSFSNIRFVIVCAGDVSAAQRQTAGVLGIILVQRPEGSRQPHSDLPH